MLEIGPKDRAELRGLMRREGAAHVRTKAVALWNLSRGKSRREVAGFLGVSGASISSWSRRYREEGVAGLRVRHGRGRPAQARPEELEEVLRQSPRAFGLAQTRWTLRALAQVVPSLRGFSDMGVWKVLRRMGYRYKRGQPQVTSPDPEYGKKRGGWYGPLGKRRSAPGR